MSEQRTTSQGSAAAQAELWSEGAQDWAEVMEGWAGWGVPVYREVLEHLEVRPETDVLDVGCGAGRFARIAADRGAAVAGLDATAAFVAIARERVPHGDFRIGDMEELPWEDDSFDVVTGFNSFFIAADMVGALREAARVARPGARIAMTVFGRPEHCRSTELFASLAQLSPAPGTGGGQRTQPGPGLHERGVLEDRAAGAGLTPLHAGYIAFTEEHADLDTMLRGYLAAPPFVRAARAYGREAVSEALAAAAAPMRTAGGRYEIADEVRYLIAEA